MLLNIPVSRCPSPMPAVVFCAMHTLPGLGHDSYIRISLKEKYLGVRITHNERRYLARMPDPEASPPGHACPIHDFPVRFSRPPYGGLIVRYMTSPCVSQGLLTEGLYEACKPIAWCYRWLTYNPVPSSVRIRYFVTPVISRKRPVKFLREP